MGKLIFNSYVGLPEGILGVFEFIWICHQVMLAKLVYQWLSALWYTLDVVVNQLITGGHHLVVTNEWSEPVELNLIPTYNVR
jgi:hypothetical protein